MRFTAILFLSVFLVSCGKSKSNIPCFKEAGASNCSELFDVIQKNLGDQEKLLDLRECYDKHCQ